MSDTESAQWRVPFAMQMLPGTLLFIGLLFQNESPRWLVEKNRLTDARKALATVRAMPQDHPEVAQELEEIVEDFNGHEKMPLVQQIKTTYSDRKILYTFCMAVILMLCQQWCVVPLRASGARDMAVLHRSFAKECSIACLRACAL